MWSSTRGGREGKRIQIRIRSKNGMIEAVLTSWMIFLCSLERLAGKDLTWDFESFMKSFSSFLRASSSTTLSRAGRIEQSKVRVCVCVCIRMCIYVSMCMHCIDQVSTTCQMSSQPQLQAQHNTCTVYSSIVSICKLQHQHIHTCMYMCVHMCVCAYTHILWSD